MSTEERERFVIPMHEERMDDWDEVSTQLFRTLPKEQCERVFAQRDCDIEPQFLGFMKIYRNLSEILPRDFTIIDLGAAFNPQCFYFKDFKKYIAVDLGKMERFQTDNCAIYEMSAGMFVTKVLPLLDLKIEKTFVIISYCPLWEGDDLKEVLSPFKNIFSFYPFR